MIYVETGTTHPARNHAIEEFLLKYKDDEVFMLWQNEPTVLIGRNQDARTEIHEDYVAREGIHVIRRLSGGGAIFCDLHNMQYTFITHKQEEEEGRSFARFARPVVEAIRELGVSAEFTGRNDIVAEGKKISGNAQYHWKNRLLHHGTILYDVDQEALARALCPKKKKLESKGVASVKSRIGTLSSMVDLSLEEFMDHIKKRVMETYDIHKVYTLTEKEWEKVREIEAKRFGKGSWNFREEKALPQKSENKTDSGLLEIRLEEESGRLKDLHILGDFFGERPVEELAQSLLGTPLEEKALLEALEKTSLDRYIQGAKPQELVAGILEAGGKR